MSVVPYQPQGLTAQQSDGNILLSWQGSLGAVTYQLQRSLDGVNFTNLISVSSIQYIDPYPGVGIVYYYQVAAVNGSGTSPYSSIVQMVAAPPGEMSLGELRLRAQQTADRVNSQFVTTSEWNYMARLALDELYDLLVGTYERFNTAPQVFVNTTFAIPAPGNQQISQFPLPDGTNYLGGVLGGLTGTPAPKFYKLTGVDLGVNTSNNAWVTLHRFNWDDRNNYVYPNSTSTIYGVYNMRYNTLNNNLVIIPVPAGNQQLRLTYTPILKGLLSDNDLTTIGYSGWLRYAIVRMAKYALDKEEGSDTSKLDAEILFLKTRIEQMASNRDEGQADTITNSRKDPMYGGTGWGWGGANGGY